MTDTGGEEARLSEMPDGEYAIIELLGHRTLVGRITEVERFGTKMMQVEPIFQGRLLDPVFHHGSAIYALTPCSNSVAVKRGPVHDFNLPVSIRCRLEPALPPPPAAVEDVGACEFGEFVAEDGER